MSIFQKLIIGIFLLFIIIFSYLGIKYLYLIEPSSSYGRDMRIIKLKISDIPNSAIEQVGHKKVFGLFNSFYDISGYEVKDTLINDDNLIIILQED